MANNWRTVPVPENMRDMPRDLVRGFPILFTQQPPIEGWEPSSAPHDFRMVLMERVIQCGKDRLCGVCGKPLNYWMAFVGGPLSVKNRSFVDPAMHVDCALYAVRVCPYMVAHAVPRREDGAYGPVSLAERARRDPGGKAEKPDRWAVLVTRGYDMENAAQAVVRHDPKIRAQLAQGMRVTLPPTFYESLLFVAKSAKSVRWFADGEELIPSPILPVGAL